MLNKCYKIGLFVLLIVVNSWAHPIVVDGDDSDWIGSGILGYKTISFGEAIWVDHVDDDFGDGGDAVAFHDNPEPYSYPLNPLFLGTEADILEWRCTADVANDMLYFLIRVQYEQVWMPFIGICVDIDHIYGSGQQDCGNYSEVRVAPENAWEYLISIYNMNVTVRDQFWNLVPGYTENYFNPAESLIEVGVSVENWTPSIWGQTIYFTVYSGLHDFDNLRSVDYYASEWRGGGGYDDTVSYHDPKIYDLCFASPEQQQLLATYTDTSSAVLRSVIVWGINMNSLQIAEEETKKLASQIDIYPNPFKDFIYLSGNLPFPTSMRFELYDILGRKVLEKDLGYTKRIEKRFTDFFGLNDGVYLYRLDGGSFAITGKLVHVR